MNTIPITVMVIIVFLVQEQLCDVVDWFKKLPDEITDAFRKLWNSIKKPFTIRRVGRRGSEGDEEKRKELGKKQTTTTTEKSMSTEFLIEMDTTPKWKFHLRRVPIPVMPKPEWRDMAHWSQQQVPKYAAAEDKHYNVRRQLMANWANNYIGPQPTRVSEAHYTTPTVPVSRPIVENKDIANSPIVENEDIANSPIVETEDVAKAWVPVVPKRAYIKDDNTYRPIDYYQLLGN